jgi:hypothetical protein
MNQKEPDLLNNILIEHTPELNKLIQAIGKEAYNSIIILEYIKQETKAGLPNQLHVVFQLIKGFIFALATEYPHQGHYDIIKLSLENNKALLNDKHAIDMLARELINFCRTLNLQLVAPKAFQAIVNANKIAETATPLKIYKHASDELDSLFIKDNLFLWDKIFITALYNLGNEGKHAVEQLKPQLREKVKLFKQQKIGPWDYWFSNPSSTTAISPILKTLVKVLLEDKAKRLLKFRDKNPPAVTLSDQKHITTLLSHRTKPELTTGTIKLVNQGSVISNTITATIPQSVIDTVFNGVNKLQTVTGHRLVRYLVQAAYDQMVTGHPDYRVLILNRGATELAERLGLNSNRIIKEIKEILHAMAYLQISAHNFSGNLIQLTQIKSSITNRQEAYYITIGTLLLPYRACDKFSNGESNLLIPIPSDPPLINPTQYYAKQYLYQTEIMSEFSKQSVHLAQHGAIYIPKERRNELGALCDLQGNIIEKIHDRWTQDGDDAPKFLEKIGDDFYTLGPNDQKALKFLKEQGRLRIKQSEKAKSTKKTKDRRML